MLHVTKQGLYKQINNLRNSLGLEPDEYGIEMIKLCKTFGIRVKNLPFCSPGLRGMAVVGGEDENDVIFLNSARNTLEQNTDCAHECIHLAFHRSEPCRTFKCFETIAPGQDKYLEWQANEGGAELLVPYRSLLRRLKRYAHLLDDYDNITAFKKETAEAYNVTEAVITFRMESLKYEISQYLEGVPLDELNILSNVSQVKKGISVKSLNEIATESYYCKEMDMFFERTIRKTVPAER